MGREVRRVPADWVHPKKHERGGHRPLHKGDAYTESAEEFLRLANEKGLQAAIDEFGQAPDQADYMPDWPEAEKTHLMMYENTSDGTPLSPAFATPEELARWLADTGASAFGGETATYEQWLSVCRGGWAPGAVIVDGVMMSGVAFSGGK